MDSHKTLFSNLLQNSSKAITLLTISNSSNNLQNIEKSSEVFLRNSSLYPSPKINKVVLIIKKISILYYIYRIRQEICLSVFINFFYSAPI